MDDEPLTSSPFDALTEKEKQIYALVQQQYTNHQIAVSLNITENTLKTHMKHIRHKLGAPRRPCPPPPKPAPGPPQISP